MNVTYAGIELRRVLRDYVSMFFIALLPAFFYVVFGAAQDFSAQRAGNGNVAMYIMISMAAYGAVTATTGVGGMAAVERAQGWGRQLGLTPLADHAYVAVKAFVAVVVAAVPIALIYLVGVLTGAEGEVLAWVLSALVVLLGASVFALYGLVMGLAFRTEAAVSAASGVLVIMGFLGNIFVPLSGTMLAIARFTPLYGYAALARYPVTEGTVPTTDGTLLQEPLWYALANVGVWLTVLALLATWLVRRGRDRQ
ncbi:ABC transporter [Ornithinimicrobium pekingense]|uniref:Transport permease YvfS n=1 Tax=Ornithinimicrobium pekingense TaxID=384677 RepID=A0ABQ2FE18_9MICO|nr:ABC transporter [Ornithinimicrobium pekingense]GGK78403.1 putative transport permease YvfS [Ornithinimicrobium pekingense]